MLRKHRLQQLAVIAAIARRLVTADSGLSRPLDGKQADARQRCFAVAVGGDDDVDLRVGGSFDAAAAVMSPGELGGLKAGLHQRRGRHPEYAGRRIALRMPWQPSFVPKSVGHFDRFWNDATTGYPHVEMTGFSQNSVFP